MTFDQVKELFIYVGVYLLGYSRVGLKKEG